MTTLEKLALLYDLTQPRDILDEQGNVIYETIPALNLSPEELLKLIDELL